MSTGKHTLYNLFGALLPIGLSFFTIPVGIELIGNVRFGVLVIIWLFLEYFGIFDIGLGRSLAQRLSSLLYATAAKRAISFWTAILINLSVGFFGCLVAWPVASYFFGHIFLVEDLLRSEILSIIPWLILAVPLTTFSSVLTGALNGRERFLELNLISILQSSLMQIIPITIAYLYGPNLELILLAVIAGKIMTLLILTFQCWRHIFKGQRCIVSSAEARLLSRFGSWVSVTAMVSPLMGIFDRFAISSLLGPQFITYYSVPYQLAQRSAVIPGALASAIFPKLSIATKLEAKKINHLALRSLAVLITPFMVAGVLLIEPFIYLWLSPEFAQQSALISKLLMFGFWVNALAYIPFTHLQAVGRPDVVAKCHLVEVLPYLIGSYVGLHYFGLTGVAVAFTFRAIVDCFVLMYFTDNFNQHIRFLIAPLIMMMVSLIMAIAAPPHSMLWHMALIILIAMAVCWSFKNMPHEMRKLLDNVRLNIKL